MHEPEVFDGTGFQKDYESDFINSEPYFFVRTKRPNCLGIPIVIASVYPPESLNMIEVIKTKKLDQSFADLKIANILYRDDEIYESKNYDGSTVVISGKNAKISILEGILYDEQPHETVIMGDKILDPVEAPYGMPIGAKTDIISGITAHTMSNLCGYAGLFFNSDGRFYDEGRELLNYMLRFTPESISLRRNLALFEIYNTKKYFEALEDIEAMYTAFGVDLPHNFIGAQALALIELGDWKSAREKLNTLKDRYILKDALEIVANICEPVKVAMEILYDK